MSKKPAAKRNPAKRKAVSVRAWCAVHKETGRVLHNLRGQYSIWSSEDGAERDAPPAYGTVRRCRVVVE